MAVLTSLSVADRPELWRDLGFELEASGDSCTVGLTSIGLGGAGSGVVGWRIEGAGDLAELPALPGSAEAPRSGATHPNGVIGLDHVVVATPDLDRTVTAFEEAGLALRRTRNAGTPGHPLVQGFFRLENTVVEVVGPPEPTGAGPARFYGLAFTVADLEATAARLGKWLRPARAAVQPGRRIATLDRSAASTVPLAFMSPR